MKIRSTVVIFHAGFVFLVLCLVVLFLYVMGNSNLIPTVVTVGMAFLLGVIVVSLFVAGRISSPIVHMARTAESITRGAVEDRVRIEDNKGETAELGNALNQMAGKLSNDIERLKKLERVRSEFLGNVSHELRTPIFSIQGFLETLLDGAVDDPAVNREFLEKAHRHADRLNILLNDLIEISRIESGEMKMSFRYFSIDDLLLQMIDEMKADVHKKGITLSVATKAEGPAEVYGDRERMRQVIVNLMDNAIKYTDQGGAITVSSVPMQAFQQVTIEDTGRGISSEHLQRVFERFYRVDKDRSRDVGGTGLGLAIVKHIVEAHGGTIRVESIVGKGSKFIFTLRR